jgi:flagellar basal-body rod protein FlgB
MRGPALDRTVGLLHAALERASRRVSAVASNLANVDTPGYRAVDVRFEELLEGAVGIEPRRTHPMHLGGAAEAPAGTVVERTSSRMRNDGNTVDVDLEMTLLASLQGRYQTAAELVRKRFALLLYAATDGRNAP